MSSNDATGAQNPNQPSRDYPGEIETSEFCKGENCEVPDYWTVWREHRQMPPCPPSGTIPIGYLSDPDIPLVIGGPPLGRTVTISEEPVYFSLEKSVLAKSHQNHTTSLMALYNRLLGMLEAVGARNSRIAQQPAFRAIMQSKDERYAALEQDIRTKVGEFSLYDQNQLARETVFQDKCRLLLTLGLLQQEIFYTFGCRHADRWTPNLLWSCTLEAQKWLLELLSGLVNEAQTSLRVWNAAEVAGRGGSDRAAGA